MLHAGFFLGPRGFYGALRNMHSSDLERFSMRGVGYVNQLYGPEHELKILQRRDAREEEQSAERNGLLVPYVEDDEQRRHDPGDYDRRQRCI